MKKSNMIILVLASTLLQFCVSSTPVNEGTANNPIDITNQSPYSGSVAANGTSYYVIKNTTALISLTGITTGEDVDLYVYDTGSFAGANLVCSGMNAAEANEKCYGVGNPDLFIEADGSNTPNGTTFTISW